MKTIKLIRESAIDLILNEYNEEGIFDQITLDSLSNKRIAEILNYEYRELERDEKIVVKNDFTISIRTLIDGKPNWKKVKNIDTDSCDLCHEKLWQAPHGGLYCNNFEHEK